MSGYPAGLDLTDGWRDIVSRAHGFSVERLRELQDYCEGRRDAHIREGLRTLESRNFARRWTMLADYFRELADFRERP